MRIKVGLLVQWKAWTTGEPVKGHVEEIMGKEARISYGGWDDQFWAKISELELVKGERDEIQEKPRNSQ